MKAAPRSSKLVLICLTLLAGRGISAQAESVSVTFVTSTSTSTSTSTDSAVDQLDPDFSYAFLARGQVGFCPGVVPNVKSVDTISTIHSGGCCGIRQMWNQDFANHHLMGHIDLRAYLESNIRAFDYRSLAYGKSVTQLVPFDAALMEQLSLRNAKVGVCVSRLDFSGINQVFNGPSVHDFTNSYTDATYDVGLKISVTLDTEKGSQALLVKEMAGETKLRTGFFDTLSDPGPNQPYLYVTEAWQPLNDSFGQFLQEVPNPEADRNLSIIQDYVSDYVQ